MKTATVKRRKRDMSRRNGSKPMLPDIDKKTDIIIKFPFDHEVILPNSHNHFRYTSRSKKNDADSYYEFVPKNKDFRPFQWRAPKSYNRSGIETKGTSVSATSLVKPWEEPFQVDVSNSFFLLGDRNPWLWTSIEFGDRGRHFLKFNEKVADQKVDMLTAFVEGRQAVPMVADAAEALFDFYRAVKKADAKSIKRIFKKHNIKRRLSKNWRNKTASSRWLELQYGWTPFVSDIAMLLSEVLDRRSTPPLIKVMHSTKLDPKNYNTRNKSVTVNNFFGIYKTSCYYTVDSPNIRKAAQWNLLNNPLLTAWELVPFSFVVDWFLPIGDFLAQFSSSDGLQFVSGTTVTHFKWEASKSNSIVVGPRFTSYSARVDSVSTQKFYMVERVTHSSSPIGYPTIKLGWNTTRALNALALVSQLRK